MSSERDKPKPTANHRLKRIRQEGMSSLHSSHALTRSNVTLDCGWGRLIFGNTFENPEDLVEAMRNEHPTQRDIAFYVRDPHIVLAHAPQEYFLDPSHTYRLDFTVYRPARRRRTTFHIRRLSTRSDAEAINIIHAERGMVPVPPDFFWSHRDAGMVTMLVAEDAKTGDILGSVMGVDHKKAFDDPEQGSSLWCLAVSPSAPHAGVGESLLRRLAEQFQARGAAYMDLSVLHDNEQAIALYEKLGFRRVNVFAVKRKNQINEKLFVGDQAETGLNPYAQIIVNEALRRGIHVDIDDAKNGFFRLSFGGRLIRCRESLTDLTSAVALSICDDKRMTRKVVELAGVRVPDQITDTSPEAISAFLQEHGSVVVKPARGEQGKGIAVGVSDLETLHIAIERARQVSEDVLLEEYYPGHDLRLVVINGEVVAAALRLPAKVIGDGAATIRQLIEKQSRRRSSATSGESTIPLDEETERCIAQAGYAMDDCLASGVELAVRKTANLHTGGTIVDVTAQVHRRLIEAAIRAASAIDIPVTGIDLMVKDPTEPDYVFIEANERPGLANHEPQPTAERFIDLLFPRSMTMPERQLQQKAYRND
ncbi:N-acetylglutaminylglutamine synthetase [Cohaesibacter celericrescens]|uniref:N-acetylglutaminylglutamine synthetase n=1 Tax=Cohaesibacter celericrescens TaxID=2067669 RepID=A0A2N5XUU5_9HYPH|nr:N-acetylglutaminylglutamine synthetase [Cohaesibacter celericrescens]PLW78264.1 N-acetylglutaminylglutamine synthetase [Cohaesibacter celericrescens]